MYKSNFEHFVTGPFKPQNKFLEDHEYGLALDALVKGCTDLLILDSDNEECRVYLGKRIVEPQPDWWFMGGRMKPGDSPQQSLERLMKRELSIDIPPYRFRPLGVHSYAWARRQQAPMDNGTCDISLVFTLVLDVMVVESIKRDPKEYSEMGWFTLEEIIGGDHFHPALRASARDVRTRFAWETLVKCVNGKIDDTSVIVKAARNLVKATAQEG